MVDPSDGHIWICDGAGGWIDGGLVVGPQGDKGEKGDKLEFGDLSAAELESLKGQKGEVGELPLISALPPL